VACEITWSDEGVLVGTSVGDGVSVGGTDVAVGVTVGGVIDFSGVAVGSTTTTEVNSQASVSVARPIKNNNQNLRIM